MQGSPLGLPCGADMTGAVSPAKKDSMSQVTLATTAVVFALILQVIGQQASTDLARVQALLLESLPDPVVAYYSPGARDRAASMKSRLSEALIYYGDRLGVAPPFALAVLNEADWKQVRSSPYGVPGVRGAPYIAFFPSDLSRSVVVTEWNAPSRRPAPRSERALAVAECAIFSPHGCV